MIWLVLKWNMLVLVEIDSHIEITSTTQTYTKSTQFDVYRRKSFIHSSKHGRYIELHKSNPTNHHYRHPVQFIRTHTSSQSHYTSHHISLFNLFSPLLNGHLLLSAHLPHTVPRDHNQTQDTSNAAEHHGNVTLRRETRGQWSGRLVCAAQIRPVFRVTGCVTAGRDTSGVAVVVEVLRDREGVAHGDGVFDQSRDETGRQVPFDVAVEKPDTRVVRDEADDEVTRRASHEDVTAHGDRGERVVTAVSTGVVIRANDGLELMTVKMERVLSGIQVVQDDLNDLVLLEEEGVRVGAVDCGVRDKGVGGAHDGENGGHLGGDIGDVVEEGTTRGSVRHVDLFRRTGLLVGAVSEVVHLHVQGDSLAGLFEECELVIGNKGEIIEGIKLVDVGRSWEIRRAIIDEPTSHVGVE